MELGVGDALNARLSSRQEHLSRSGYPHDEQVLAGQMTSFMPEYGWTKWGMCEVYWKCFQSHKCCQKSLKLILELKKQCYAVWLINNISINWKEYIL